MVTKMTTADLDAFLKIPPEEHFRSREKAIKASGVWKALADAISDPEVKAQWQDASDNAIGAAKNLSPGYAHNAGIAAKNELKKARSQLGTSEEGKKLAAVMDVFGALADLMINKSSKKA